MTSATPCIILTLIEKTRLTGWEERAKSAAEGESSHNLSGKRTQPRRSSGKQQCTDEAIPRHGKGTPHAFPGIGRNFQVNGQRREAKAVGLWAFERGKRSRGASILITER